MPAIRSVSVFSVLYVLVMVNCTPLAHMFGIKAACAIVAGFVIGFPIDRVSSLFLWLSESKRLTQSYRTCIITAPWLMSEKRDWRFLGTVKEKR